MSNNLYKVEKDLRSIAKRYKSIKYSVGLAILFLMLGTGAFSEEVNNVQASEIPTREEIASSRENLKNSVGSLQAKIDQARAENEKGLAGLRLELIQLMEQGDQVVKSPWSSWQFGANYMYSKWNGTYKGRGDKAQKYRFEGVFTRSTNPFERYTSPESTNYKLLSKSPNPYSASTSNRSGVLGYGIASNIPVPEPIVNLELSAGIRPRKVDKQPLNIQLDPVNAPAAPTLNVSANTPVAVTPPTVTPPTVTLNLPTPNTKPFNDFSFIEGRFGDYEPTVDKIEAAATSYTLGVNPNNPDINPNNVNNANKATYLNNKAYQVTNGTISPTGGKIAAAIWRINDKRGTLRNEDTESNWNSDMTEDVNNPIVHGFNYGGNSAADRVKFYVAGDILDNGSNKLGTQGRKGGVAIHSVWNGTFHDIEGYLKGRATMFSIETWHSPKLVFKNIAVDIQGNENTLFYIYPHGYEGVVQKTADYNSFAQRGAFIGQVNADIKSQKNAIYSVMGLSGGLNITSTGIYRLEGANNLVYSSLGYSPNFQNFIKNDASNGYVSDRYKTGMTPVINLKTAPESYGDGNVIMYFSDLIPDNTAGYSKTSIYGGNYDNWKRTKIGIFQGEIRASARIGEKLNINDTNTQTEVGNKIQQADGSLIDGDNKYVENNVGILAQSGQRSPLTSTGRRITPTEDLGATGFDYVNDDKIHALYVNDIDITFGKYSKGGIMVASERGTQVDVAVTDTANPHHTDVIKNGSGNPIPGKTDKATIPVRTDDILDYNKTHVTYTNDNKIISSTVEATNEAATGTIIGYAKGSWKDSDTRMGRVSGVTGMSSATQNAFKDAKSEINFGTPVRMSARYAEIGGKKYNPVAYVAEGGKITAKDTTAYGYGSVIAYAKNYTNNSTTSSGEITINGNIEAKDEWAANDTNTIKEKYKNLGAYADGDGTKIKVTGNATINGLGAFAANKGKVVISGTSSVLNSGKSTSLAALSGGNVTFGGGNISVGSNAEDSSTPFYADTDPNSKINFTGSTKVKMTKGTFLVGAASEYQAASATTDADGKITDGTKYNGMSKVELEVSGDAKIVKNTVGGPTVTWNGPGSLATDIKNTTQINKITAPAANYLAYYSNGNYVINADAQLGNSTAADSFDTVKMTREKVTINSGKKVYSTTGVGLAMASSNGAASNAVSGYENNGTVDISGGGATKAGINVSYGTIKNNGTVKLDKGVGLYGTNGSRIENTSNGIINVTSSGYGIVGMATGQTAQNYGRDIAAGTAVDIVNNGQINVAGDNAIAIYADDNKGVALNEITITNTHKITVSGNRGVGIALRDSINSGNGGIVNVTGTGSSDIVTGTNGVGIYAENSEVKLNSNYGIETKEGGVGIYAAKSSIPTASTLEYKYSGSTSGRGMAIVYTKANTTNSTNIKLVNSTGTIGGLIGIFANGGGTFTNNGTITGSSTAKEFAVIAENSNIVNNGAITLGNASSITTPNIALYSKTNNSITNTAMVKVGNNSIGLYGYAINNTGDITVGEKGSAIYSQGGNVNITSGTINVGKNEAVGVYTAGNSQTITSNATAMNIGDGSFGFANVGKGNTIISQTPNVSLKNNSMYIYSKNNATINNATNLKSVGTTGNNYGIYASGTVTNTGNIDFKNGLGNVGIYSTYGGTATNNATISVGESDATNSIYSIGMAAGFIGDKATPAYTGNIINNGTINVTGKESIGMYGVGLGTTVYNGTPTNKNATINLGADGTMGMYLDEGAKGYNYGTITTVGSPKKAVGIVVRKGAEFTNEGTVNINSAGGYAFFKANGGVIKNYGIFNISGGAGKEYTPGNKPTTKMVGGVEIEAKAGAQEATIKDPSGNIVKPTLVPITEGKRNAEISSIGMYIDTLRGTNPINGLGAIRVAKADLIIGSEAAQKTTSKYIQVSQDILKPYNKVMANNPQITDWGIYSGAFTWIATGTINKTTGLINNIYMAKIPYTKFAGNQSTPVDSKDTYNFLDGLEQRYGVEGIGTRENQVFQKLNGIGNNEEILFYQATDEMMGHQYANVQQRVQATGIILDKEFNYLRDEWRTASKDSNKIKTFGTNGEYKTDTAGVIDYKNNAYGVAYVHENEDIKLGRGIGWYTGIVHNTFKFKDIGRSKEQMLQVKVGLLKSVPFDDNNSLNWTISGDIFVGRNRMHRKFLVVDEIFNAKSKYYTYGIGVRNEIGKEFRLSEGFTLRPYAALKLEYGRVSKIREKSGEIKLEVKQNQYFSVRPEIGAELGFKHYFGMKALRTTLGVAYENELGRVANGKNKARVVDTTADWFNIRGEKEDRKGNVKVDLNVGVDNTRVGVTANVGYDTKGENLRGGLGLRIIF
ncbi:autotransporter-associated N-terminal domain-containing protein [Fusobacterium polymorphum]|uniref:autotransporter-associated N-terminal domain-containing protein n=1 Tax=Fusobacterium nucleatum subsp. polymorphum TaxID=76857 RepID=UPI0030D4E39D